jgi:O-antigen ligase/polysaccharide polymerase Wzy-like membrane protein
VEHADTAHLAAVAGAVGAVLVLLARGRWPLLIGLVVLLAAEAGLASSLGSGPLSELGSAKAVGAGAVGLVILCAAAAVLVRWPALTPLAVLIAAPFRPPLDFGSANRFLVSIATDGRLGRLLPLYFVLGAAVLALAWRALRADGAQPRAAPEAADTPRPQAGDDGPAPSEATDASRPPALPDAASRPLPRQLALPAAAFFAFAFLSLLWAKDLEAGVNLLVFFTLPFVLLLVVVARSPYPDWLPRALGIAALALAGLFALVGLWQAATHELFFYAPNLAVSNANTDIFRVTSLFGDPSLYGRHLVLGICVILALLTARRGPRWPLIGLLVLLWAGLLFSYSQSSMVALLIVTAAIAVIMGDRTIRLIVAVAALALVVAAAGFATYKLVDGQTLDDLTSDRTNRIEYTLRVAEHYPIVGVGVAGQARVSRELVGSDRPTPAFVSHTTPLTVLAELGIVGLALYVWLMVGGTRTILAVGRRDTALGLALGAAFLALFVHALFYSGFLEDPLTWVVLGIAAGWLVAQPPLPGPTAEERAAARRAAQAAAG